MGGGQAHAGVRRWLKDYREGECNPEIIAAIADCMAIIAVLSNRS